jgi:hypothetical protein
VTEGALAQLQEYKLDQKFNADFLGFQASAAICDGLDIPLLPFKETDALANRYATKFSESLITQDKIAIPNADLEFEVVLIKASKEKVPSRQQGIIYLKRRIIIGVRIFDRGLPADQQKILQVVAGAPEDSDIIRYDQPDDDNPDRDFVFFKGYSTARGLYNTLYDNNGKLIIFDDCDSVLEDKTSKNILKSALDSYEERTISWMAKMNKNDEYPSQFDFTGRIIFISNKSKDSIDGALKSRSLMVDLTMTPEEKIERLTYILPNILPEYDMETKELALNFLDNVKNDVDINIRTFIMVSKMCKSFPDTWRKLASYSVQQ